MFSMHVNHGGLERKVDDITLFFNFLRM
jgi:hypothetical protein